jgi:hypothetical protein
MLPATLSRSQAEAVLRCFDIPMRRIQAVELLRPRLPHSDHAWADAFAQATTGEIRAMCGDPNDADKQWDKCA